MDLSWLGDAAVTRMRGSDERDCTQCCHRCGRRKPRTREYFVVSKECRDGLSGTCKECARAYQARWRKEHPERDQRARARERAKARERWHQKVAARIANEPFKDRAVILRQGMTERARRLGLPYDSDRLTVSYLMNWLKQQPQCECCGRALAIRRRLDQYKQDASPSIDRVRPELGYVLGNVALLCWRCNNLKRNASPEELLIIATWLRRRLGSEPREAAQ